MCQEERSRENVEKIPIHTTPEVFRDIALNRYMELDKNRCNVLSKTWILDIKQSTLVLLIGQLIVKCTSYLLYNVVYKHSWINWNFTSKEILYPATTYPLGHYAEKCPHFSLRHLINVDRVSEHSSLRKPSFSYFSGLGTSGKLKVMLSGG